MDEITTGRGTLGTDQQAVEAIGKASEALEYVERARGTCTRFIS